VVTEKGDFAAGEVCAPHKDEAYCLDESYILPENLNSAWSLAESPNYQRQPTALLGTSIGLIRWQMARMY
jgi:hypothetical protein